LKLYFREMNIPLFPKGCVKPLADCCNNIDDPRERSAAVREALKEHLSPSSFKLVQYLFRLLAQVAAHSDVNKMTPTNLAICWGPTLFRGGGSIMGIIQILITTYDDIFLVE